MGEFYTTALAGIWLGDSTCPQTLRLWVSNGIDNSGVIAVGAVDMWKTGLTPYRTPGDALRESAGKRGDRVETVESRTILDTVGRLGGSEC
jgi:hypothetical protein